VRDDEGEDASNNEPTAQRVRVFNCCSSGPRKRHSVSC
ncbi:hypothetical protein EE612_043332, partial [Oryza sativa]